MIKWLKYTEAWASGVSSESDYVQIDVSKYDPQDQKVLREYARELGLGEENCWSEHYRGLKLEVVDRPDDRWIQEKLSEIGFKLKHLLALKATLEKLQSDG